MKLNSLLALVALSFIVACSGGSGGSGETPLPVDPPVVTPPPEPEPEPEPETELVNVSITNGVDDRGNRVNYLKAWFKSNGYGDGDAVYYPGIRNGYVYQIPLDSVVTVDVAVLIDTPLENNPTFIQQVLDGVNNELAQQGIAINVNLTETTSYDFTENLYGGTSLKSLMSEMALFILGQEYQFKGKPDVILGIVDYSSDIYFASVAPLGISTRGNYHVPGFVGTVARETAQDYIQYFVAGIGHQLGLDVETHNRIINQTVFPELGQYARFETDGGAILGSAMVYPRTNASIHFTDAYPNTPYEELNGKRFHFTGRNVEAMNLMRFELSQAGDRFFNRPR